MYSDMPLVVKEVFESGDNWAIENVETILDIEFAGFSGGNWWEMKEYNPSKTLEEKIAVIQQCADNTDGNIAMLSSVYSCLKDARECIARTKDLEFSLESRNDWENSANMWIEKAAQYCWGFNRPKIW